MTIVLQSRLARMGPVAALVLLASLALAAGAAAQPAPQPVDCDVEPDSGARIKCKFGNIVAQQIETAEMIASMPDLPETQKQALMNQSMRASNAQGRASGEDFFQLTKKKSPTCEVLEILGDSMGDEDGVCTGNEDCVEVDTDQIGNNDGICRPRRGANREVCVEICDEEGINSDPDNFDDDLGQDVEDQLDELTDQYVELNGMLEQGMQLQAAAQILAANGDSCSALIASRADPILFNIVVIAADTSRGLADIAERGCDQTAFGFNGSTVCIVVETVASVARIGATTFEFIDASIDSKTIDESFACLKGVNAAVDDLKTEVGNLKTAVGDSNDALIRIETQLGGLQSQLTGVEQEVAEVKQLVNTPLGLREEFPSQTPE